MLLFFIPARMFFLSPFFLMRRTTMSSLSQCFFPLSVLPQALRLLLPTASPYMTSRASAKVYPESVSCLSAQKRAKKVSNTSVLCIVSARHQNTIQKVVSVFHLLHHLQKLLPVAWRPIRRPMVLLARVLSVSSETLSFLASAPFTKDSAWQVVSSR